MNSNEFNTLLKQNGAKYVYNRILLDEKTYIFKQKFNEHHIEKYHELKTAVSDNLDVPVKNVAIVGSAKLGFSLTPGRNFHKFSEESDLDLVVVSRDLFLQLWDSHLHFKNSLMKGKNYSYSDIAKAVFRHFISIADKDITPEMQDHFSYWINKVSTLKKFIEQEFRISSEINYRIYDDWKYVEQYHVDGLNTLLEEQNK
jgi:hypothetical protein